METGKIVNSILAATADVFGTMLKLEVATVEEGVEPKGPDTMDGVIALVGLSGKWAGTGMVRCDAALACELYAHLLTAPVPPGGVTPDVLDTVAEIANMIIGTVKNDLEEETGPMGMSIPTVVFGHSLTMRNAGTEAWAGLTFACAGSQLHVHVSLKPNQVPRVLLPGFSPTQIADA